MTAEATGPAAAEHPLPALPLFPLQTVLFPGGLLHLKVFEARYLDLMSQCLRSGNGFGVVCLVQGSEVHAHSPAASSPADGAARLSDVAVLAELLEVDAEQAGILQVRCLGRLRHRLGSPWQREDGLWLAPATPCEADEPLPVPERLQACADALARAISTLSAQSQHPFLAPYQLDDAGWVANRWCEILPIPLAAKQRLMALDEPSVRLELVDEFLRSNGVI